MKKIIFAIIFHSLFFSNIANAYFGYNYTNIIYWLQSDKKTDQTYAVAYLQGTLDSIISNEIINQWIFDKDAIKICIPTVKDENGENTAEMPELNDVILLMNEFRNDDSNWKTDDPRYEDLRNNTSYLMIWSLTEKYPCGDTKIFIPNN